MTARTVVIGLGANLGDRHEQLRTAALQLREAGLGVKRLSGVYQSPPAGGPPQPDYLNAAVAVRSRLEWSALLDVVRAVERSLGRIRPDPVRWGPRTIDVDVLWTDAGVVALEGLIIPHPRLGGRAFAIQPLLDVAPLATDPQSGLRYADLPAATAPLHRVGSLTLA